MARNAPSSSKRSIVKKTSSKQITTSNKRKMIQGAAGTGGQRKGRSGRQSVSGKMPVAACPSCFAVYYDGHWHAPFKADNMTVDTSLLRSEMCEACKMADTKASPATAGFGGEVILSGWHDLNDKMELLHLVRNAGKTAQAADPEHRVVRIVDEGEVVRVYTTENQLAASIGKKLDHARKGGTLEIIWTDRDRPTQVTWVGPKK